MLSRARAIDTVLSLLDDELVVTANGMPAREAHAAADRPETFFMIGSMGLAASIGLGLAMARPERRVVVLDAVGNLLMGLGVLAMVAERAPRRFLHVVLDNGAYETTGGQRAVSATVALDRVAAGAGYPHVRCVDDEAGLRAAAEALLRADGPAFLRVKVAPGTADPPPPRIPHPPEEIAARFRRAAAGTAS